MRWRPGQTIFFCALAGLLCLSACSSHRRLVRDTRPHLPAAKLAGRYAAMLHVPERDIRNGPLYEFIDRWYGTPYEYGGLDQHGIDCSGLVYLLYQEVYHEQIPRSTSGQVKIIKRKYENQLKEGDLVFFNYDGKRFSHVGVYLQNGYYVHASTSHGVMISRIRDPYTYKYFSRCGTVISAR